jgi:hypothetical protein
MKRRLVMPAYLFVTYDVRVWRAYFLDRPMLYPGYDNRPRTGHLFNLLRRRPSAALYGFVPPSIPLTRTPYTMSSPPLDFKDLVVLVTGAGSGIGKV